MADETPSSYEVHEDTPAAEEVDAGPTPQAPSDFFPDLLSSTADAQSAPATGPTAPTGPPKPTVDAQGRALNPRSCVTCRKRKVKCDKVHPCSNCSRAHIDCIFPAPGRAPRKARKLGETGRDKELLERLRRLEGVVKGLGVDVPPGEEKTPDGKEGSKEAEPQRDGETADHAMGEESTNGPVQVTNGSVNGQSMGKPQWTQKSCPGDRDEEFHQKTRWVEETSKGRFENRFGRLVINEGKSRYINNSFWANLSNEVEDLKGILNQSEEESDVDSPGQAVSAPSAHQGFIFGFSSQNVDLLSLHPLPGQIELYWQTFKENVDPLVKVLHVPSIEPTVLSAASHLSNLSKGFETLLFAIYYGATTSLTSDTCIKRFGEDRAVLLSRYRFALEQALARANFLTTEEIIVLQAFVLFLMCLRRNNDARVIWTLTGLVVRIAQTIGIHRDGLHFGLAPFEIEMRRRLWWQVCILDTRASEDHGCDPTIIEQAFDTKMPLNINDTDIAPKSKDFPAERTGCTDMSFCLIRFEVANTFRRINYIPPGPPQACGNFFASVTLQDKEKWITECHQRLEERYLKHCDMSVPLFWVTATVARLMMSKMWLMVYHPFQRQDGGASLPDGVKEKLFITSLENIEYSILLETEARTMKWGWLFRTYMQWHALAFMLSELCQRTSGELVERAWIAVEKTRDGRWGEHVTDDSKTGHLWRPLKKLYRKAKEAHARGLQEEQLQRYREGSQPPSRNYSPNANPMFGHPKRPQMVRAPLSQAQLQRFSDGPVFGTQPLDSHELLKSPKLPVGDSAGEGDPMDTAGLSALQPTKSQDEEWKKALGATGGGLTRNVAFGDEVSSTYGTRVAWGMNDNSLPRFGSNFLASGSGDMNIDFASPFAQENNSNPATINQTRSASGPQQPPNFSASIGSNNSNPAPIHDAYRQGSVDSTHIDGLMDTPNGNLNWENWDQLVRQFGMDVDQPAADANGANGWSGPNWEMRTEGQNLRFGMGMGGGDWF